MTRYKQPLLKPIKARAKSAGFGGFQLDLFEYELFDARLKSLGVININPAGKSIAACRLDQFQVDLTKAALSGKNLRTVPFKASVSLIDMHLPIHGRKQA